MAKITLISSDSTAVVSGEGKEFNHFLDWLNYYNPTTLGSIKWGYCPIDSENRLIACKVKARKLNLAVS